MYRKRSCSTERRVCFVSLFSLFRWCSSTAAFRSCEVTLNTTHMLLPCSLTSLPCRWCKNHILFSPWVSSMQYARWPPGATMRMNMKAMQLFDQKHCVVKEEEENIYPREDFTFPHYHGWWWIECRGMGGLQHLLFIMINFHWILSSLNVTDGTKRFECPNGFNLRHTSKHKVGGSVCLWCFNVYIYSHLKHVLAIQTPLLKC